MASKRKSVYDHVWAAMRQSEIFTIDDLIARTQMSRPSVREYVKRWERANIIGVCSIGENGRKHYFIKKRNLTAPPRVSRDGKIVEHGLKHDHMWRSMKMLGRFTKHDLAVHASTDEVTIKVETAAAYISLLCRAGYVKCVLRSDYKASEYVFLKDRNTGFKAPCRQRSGSVFDPNLNRVVWRKDGTR